MTSRDCLELSLRDISLCVAQTAWADLFASYRLYPLFPTSFFSTELKKFRNERKQRRSYEFSTNFNIVKGINYGNMRFISSRDLTKYFANMPPSLSISAQGRGEEHFSSVKLCFQNMDERLAGRIVLKYHSSCWFSIFLLLVFHSPVISAGNNSFRFWNQKFLLLIRWIHKAEIILRLCIYSQVYYTVWIMPFIS